MLGWGGWGLFAGVAGGLFAAFWLWMLVHCHRHEPDREFWFITMLIIPPAAVVYFFARWLPGGGAKSPGPLRSFGRKQEIQRLRIAAEQIGNAHQFVELGDVLRECGRYAEAAGVYRQALQKEPRNMPALWGAAVCEIELEEFPAAKERLETVLGVDDAYKFGDVSLAYGKCLCCLGEREAAHRHLSGHINRWRHPEAMYLLATLYADRGDPAAARSCLTAMLLDIDGSPKAIARRQLTWRRKGQKLLGKLSR